MQKPKKKKITKFNDATEKFKSRLKKLTKSQVK